MTEVFKIVEKYEDGYKTLFRGLNGSRKISTNIWLQAEEKLVRDGSGGKLYLSGFHVFKTENDADNYLGRFVTPERVIIKCYAKNLRQKPTNKIVFLADEIFIPKMKLEKRYKCWTCKNFSYKYPRKYGHCSWAKQLVMLFSWMKNHHGVFIYDTILRPKDECKGYEKGKPTFS